MTTKRTKDALAVASAKANVKTPTAEKEPKTRKPRNIEKEIAIREAVATPPKSRPAVEASTARLRKRSAKAVGAIISAALGQPVAHEEVDPAETPNESYSPETEAADLEPEASQGEEPEPEVEPEASPEGPEVIEAPATPLTKFLINSGFSYVTSKRLDDGITLAHGYQHVDGSAVLFSHHATSTNIDVNWTLARVDGTEASGVDAKALVLAIQQPPSTFLPTNVMEALALLRKLTTTAFVASYSLAALDGDKNYKARVDILKALRKVDKVLVKESGVAVLRKEFYAALGVEKKGAAAAAEFEGRCVLYQKQEEKATAAMRKVEKAEIAETLRLTASERLVVDDKPLLPVHKPLGAEAARAAADKALQEELAGQIARKRRQEEYTPMAVPRPDAELAIVLDDVCILEDPSNGIVLMLLEKLNSQGAICVYNNGSRVAAGVLELKDLISMRRVVSENLVRDVNQLLHPITSDVIVTPVAERYLTAVLEHCKEIQMTDKTVVTKKFAPPVKTVAKSATKTAAKSVEAKTAAKKAPKKDAAAGSGRAAKFTPEMKIKVIQKENPGREGTKRHAWYELYRTQKTVGEYIAAGGDRGYLTFDSGKGFIEIK